MEGGEGPRPSETNITVGDNIKFIKKVASIFPKDAPSGNGIRSAEINFGATKIRLTSPDPQYPFDPKDPQNYTQIRTETTLAGVPGEYRYTTYSEFTVAGDGSKPHDRTYKEKLRVYDAHDELLPDGESAELVKQSYAAIEALNEDIILPEPEQPDKSFVSIDKFTTIMSLLNTLTTEEIKAA